jgi:LysM repeat protein
MYQNSVIDLPNLTQEKYENIFKVYLDESGKYFYNLLEAITLPDNLPEGLFGQYVIEPGDTWPYISYKIYQTISLWWAICIANNIQNPTQKLEPGTTLKIPTNNLIQLLIKEINT